MINQNGTLKQDLVFKINIDSDLRDEIFSIFIIFISKIFAKGKSEFGVFRDFQAEIMCFSTEFFAHIQVSWSLKYRKSFSSNRCFFLKMIQSQKILILHNTVRKSIFSEGSISLCWNFQNILETMRLIYGDFRIEIPLFTWRNCRWILGFKIRKISLPPLGYLIKTSVKKKSFYLNNDNNNN